MDKFQRIGRILSPMELEIISNIEESDKAEAIARWEKVAPKPFRNLLSAVQERGRNVQAR
ncbi:hypothetical protein [Floridanema evergladense]|uniref:Uncharacterized protein n=1 Tax=Floridaenema evergladense BLCC-F167 TaxID=3153639 RepID=A0ABV4WD25_9CYAN